MTHTLDELSTRTSNGQHPAGRPPARSVSALIVGTGFGGLGAAVALREAGVRDITVVEKAERVGGVWRENTYPGAACDVPSSLYSWSFAPNPGWPRRFAEQPDILRYIETTARDLGLLELVEFGTEVTSAHWDDAAGRWHVDGVRGGTAVSWDVDVFVCAVGQLSRPAMPRLDGVDRFAGPAFHSATWDHGVDLRGKRVGVIGTGASAIQFVPQIQPLAGHVTVFQRSAPYVVPKPDRSYTRAHLEAFRRVPPTQRFGRGLTNRVSTVLNRAMTEQTRLVTFIERYFQWWLKREVPDPELRAKLTPDYPIGCKRLLFSNDWYSALVSPNVEVVTDPIAEVTESGLVTRTEEGEREHDLDVIIYGTGFAATEFLAPMTLTGRDGVGLDEVWADGAHAYLGVTVPRFPNLFIVYGPNTNLGGGSIVSMIEAQTGYIAQAVQCLARGERPAIEVREQVSDRYDREVQDRLQQSVWAGGCASWYQNESGRITTNWVGTVEEYKDRLEVFDASDYVAHAAHQPASTPA